jgi:Holliday junction resolvase RusA-like endonuclease
MQEGVDMSTIKFVIDCEATSWKRPAAKATSKFYTDTNRDGKLKLINTISKKDIPIVPIKTPIALSVDFVFRSKSKDNHGNPYVSKNKKDIDNLLKLLLDAFNGIIWDDDSLIHSVVANKTYGENSQIIMVVKYF